MTSRTRLLLVPILLLAIAPSAGAEPSKRGGKWQITLGPVYTAKHTISAPDGATADLDARTSFDFGFGYNLNEQWELNLDVGWGDANYDATVKDDNGDWQDIKFNYYISYFNFGGSYNFLKSRLTPFIGGNLGWSYIDSGIPTGNIDQICWWDPFWGFWYCGYYAETHTDTKWNYGADLGLRFDVSRSVFLKGAIGQTWIDFGRAGTQAFTNYKLSLGFMF